MQSTGLRFSFLWTRPYARAGLALAMEDEGMDLDMFYPSFINWCNRTADRVADPEYGGLTEDEKECFSILKQEHIPSAELLRIMRQYLRMTERTGGMIATGLVDARKAYHTDQDVRDAEEELHRRVRYIAELERVSNPQPNPPPQEVQPRRKRPSKVRRMEKRAAQRAAVSARQSAAQVTQTSQMSTLPDFDVAALKAGLPILIDQAERREEEKEDEKGGVAVPVEMALRPKQ